MLYVFQSNGYIEQAVNWPIQRWKENRVVNNFFFFLIFWLKWENCRFSSFKGICDKIGYIMVHIRQIS